METLRNLSRWAARQGRLLAAAALLLAGLLPAAAQAADGGAPKLRRTIDARHPAWLIHVDVWFAADPQKIIDLIPADIRPYVVLNLSLSCQYDTEQEVYKLPQNAVLTYRSWASVCCRNNMWFTCQPASGGHTHIQDSDLETFEMFFRDYPNFLGWNYAEQFWGFDAQGDRSSSTQESRWELFANLVEMSHKYGGLLIESFCGNMWAYPLSPVGQLKRNARFMQACREHPENVLFLYKYTSAACWYNDESVTIGPFVSGYAANYGIRYDNCGWDGATAAFEEKKGFASRKRTYPASVGIAPALEQTALNGACVWDGPELTWTEDMHEVSATTTPDGYRRRQWATFTQFDNIWLDMFRKVLDGTVYIPTREEVVGRTKIAVVSDMAASQGDQKAYATPNTLYDGLYKQQDALNYGDGYMMDNMCYFKRTGRYQAIPVLLEGYDELAATIPTRAKLSTVWSNVRWTNQAYKVRTFDAAYPEEYTGDLFVARHRNELVTYYPFSYYRAEKRATASVPLLYNSCERMELDYTEFNGGMVREYADRIELYFNNFRTDTVDARTDIVRIYGAAERPTFSFTNRSVNDAVSGCLALSDTWEDGVYTLAVSHMGPVDITVRCGGASAEGKRTDTLPTGLVELPEQPADYDGELVVEAENLDTKNVAKVELNPYANNPSERGHSAMGYVSMGTSKSSAVRGFYGARAAGAYRMSFRYASPGGAPVLTLAVNGKSQRLRFAKTETQSDWTEVDCEVEMKEGENEFVLKAFTDPKGMLLDLVRIAPVQPDPSGVRLPDAPAAAAPAVVGRYDLSGRAADAAQRGVQLLRMSDGTVRKVWRK